MYKGLYTFLDNKNIIYDLQFGFEQQYSISMQQNYAIHGVSNDWF